MDWRRELMGGLSSEMDINNYLTIEALENGLTASLSINACEYCVDGDGNWKSLTAGTATESINTGQTLSFRGNLTPVSNKGIGTFTISKKCNLKGNCMSMLFDDNADNNYSLSGKDCAFYRLFKNCANIINVSENFLPATTLSTYCYTYMFQDCTSLVNTLELPATTLQSGCYLGMFYGCAFLTTAPELPATTLASDCYHYMFNGCTNLVNAPSLPATTLANYCYSYMFYNCTNLVNAPALPATTLEYNCYQSMFYGCSSLTTAPALPATTLVNYCYSFMFSGCTNLVNAPELPATTLVDRCYEWMFASCKKLNYIKILATDISATNCLYNWVFNIASVGTFIKNPEMTSLPTGTSGIPSGWTVVNDGEESGGSNEITFYIADNWLDPNYIEYTALEGMTWEKWVNSEYNIDNFICTSFFGEMCIQNINGYTVIYQGEVVYPEDTIIANNKYDLNL